MLAFWPFTRPMFLSAQYGLYTSANPPTPTHPYPEIRILPKSLYGKNAQEGEAPHSFFSHFYGSSWHADDAGFITFLGTTGKKLMYLGGVVLVLGAARLVYIKKFKRRRYIRRRSKKRSNGNKPLGREGEYHMVSLVTDDPTATTMNGIKASSEEDGSDSDPSLLLNAVRKTRKFILTAPATLLPSHHAQDTERTGILYFLPAFFLPDPPIRTPRSRTASDAGGLYPSLLNRPGARRQHSGHGQQFDYSQDRIDSPVMLSPIEDRSEEASPVGPHPPPPYEMSSSASNATSYVVSK